MPSKSDLLRFFLCVHVFFCRSHHHASEINGSDSVHQTMGPKRKQSTIGIILPEQTQKTVTMTLPMALSLKGDKFYTYMSVQTSYAVDIAQMHRTGTHIYAHCPPIRFHPAHVREPSLQSSGITVRCMTVGNPTTKREIPHYCCDYLSQNNKMMRAYHSPQRNAQHA